MKNRLVIDTVRGDGMKVLEAKDICYSYKEHEVLKEVNFHINKGEIVGLLGSNGAGKSTLLSICATLLKPSKGNITYNTTDKIGFVPQEIALYDNMTAKENLEFFSKLYGLKSKEIKEKIEKVANMVEISLRDKKKVKQLSGGMQRRVNIAIALLNNPEILIMDEPTVGIDIQSRKYILNVMKTLNREGVSILYSSHYTDEIYSLCSRLLILREGIIVANKVKEDLTYRDQTSIGGFEEEIMKFMFS
ncbi:MAG: ABC transporter ATP-binding protein [Clostridiaceae bacterium]|nr:ABC transporter ATP-binding protein [Clostridiaceae bacterium]